MDNYWDYPAESPGGEEGDTSWWQQLDLEMQRYNEEMTNGTNTWTQHNAIRNSSRGSARSDLHADHRHGIATQQQSEIRSEERRVG